MFKNINEIQVLIATPVTMAAPHVAEALGIPFMWAFTMPWTPTEDFPNPFAQTTSEVIEL